jgi:NADPH-dependent 2,4-dienoyl-CoA reductase/sulfur reductase-like enzyme/nitrite reductase/ring-hydroxylating ferredoxin subunit
MSEAPGPLTGPDFVQGIAAADIADDGMVLGHAHGEPVILARRGDELFAIGAACTHYGGPLAEGLLVGETIRCPWHHACFSLRTGAALRAPALNAVSCWRVEQQDGLVYIRQKLEPAKPVARPMARSTPGAVVIVGGGAAGNAAAETLRNEGYSGRITIVSADDSGPCDRPNLSKDYLAGNASEDWIPLRSPGFYEEHGIDLLLSARAVAIDTRERQVELADGRRQYYDALLLATGAEPVRLTIPGADHPHVRYLRSLADSRALIARALTARRAVVIGASFIGLEVAASLRARNIEVHVVAPEACPMERIMGAGVGNLIRALHEQHGVVFHLGTTAVSLDERSVTLHSGEVIQADLVVVGIGVRPVTSLAERAGLASDRGILVNEHLETSVAGIFAAGDIARWPDRLTGERIRVEHWVVAERQGQTAARNILGRQERFDAVPFFWSQHYDLAISYVGHAERWDRIDIDGDIDARDCTVAYWRDERKLAVLTINRDLESLRSERAFEESVAP